jgi:hypothetical protein
MTTRPKPHHEVYTIVGGGGDGKKNRRVKIGASFLNKDGSESMILDALPSKGKLQLRTPKAKEDANIQQA